MPRRLEVVQALCKVGVVKIASGLQLYNDLLVDEQIGNEFTNYKSIVEHADRSLLTDFETCFLEFVSQGILVIFLQKPWAERIRHLESTADNDLS